MAQELLFRAAQHGDVEEAVLILDKGRALPSKAMPPSNTTPLHAASRAGMLDMVELLLTFKADPNMKEVVPCGGKAPLHLAAAINHVGIAGAILAAGGDPVLRDARGHTPLHIAAQAGHVEVTHLLCAHGADPNIRDFAGFNAAWWAKEFKHLDLLAEYAKMQVEPLKMSTTERLAFSGVRLKAPGKSKKKDGGAAKSSKGNASARGKSR
eukprot:TRINITY_DN103943_c0_g1_i1.p1 TRINITY_DN103943_c0_g1~~TRINITY_DN103943_c0_g1_i1.p1  ORF type:complete len:210 (-),score=45.65 TRINITY_DN103943_c0_g1_i1:75-704(-)